MSQLENISREIFTQVRTTIMLNMRFMDMAVFRLKPAAAPESFHVRDYTERIFNMYDEGEMETVTLRCRHHMIDHIIDYFGKDVEPFNITEETFDVNIRVCVSTTFFSWVMGYVGDMTIAGPQKAVEKLRHMLQTALAVTDK